MECKCPSCQSTLIKKNGHIHNGKQKYQCLACKKQFVLDPTQKIIDEKTKNLISKTLLERVSLEGICRIFDVSMPWLLDFIECLIKELPENLNAEVVNENDEADINFVFESTGAGLTYAKHLKQAKENGYEIHLVYLWLYSPDLAVQRVAQRVKQGGHNVPKEDIIRRYYRGLHNLIHLYSPLADTLLVLDNSSQEGSSKRIVAQKKLDAELYIEDERVWERILELGESANVYK